jgi:TatA/E family protein of Tat protein translocase
MGRIGIWEILLVLLIVLLTFGAKRLPEIGRALGRAIREFKKGQGCGCDKEKTSTFHDNEKISQK